MNAQNPEDLRDVENESEILSSLNHRNVIKYKEVIKVSPMSLVLILEYANGGDLNIKILEARQKSVLIAEDTLVHWIAQIVLGLEYLHANGVLHRDIKPANIFLMRDGTVKLADFGMSRHFHEIEDPNEMWCTTTVGSPMYMSPEILYGSGYGQKADIWALGCALFEVMTLQKPFDATSYDDLFRNIKTLQFSKQLPSYYSDKLRGFVESLLCGDNRQRPTAGQLRHLPFLRALCDKYDPSPKDTPDILSGGNSPSTARNSKLSSTTFTEAVAAMMASTNLADGNYISDNELTLDVIEYRKSPQSGKPVLSPTLFPLSPTALPGQHQHAKQPQSRNLRQPSAAASPSLLLQQRLSRHSSAATSPTMASPTPPGFGYIHGNNQKRDSMSKSPVHDRLPSPSYEPRRSLAAPADTNAAHRLSSVTQQARQISTDNMDDHRTGIADYFQSPKLSAQTSPNLQRKVLESAVLSKVSQVSKQENSAAGGRLASKQQEPPQSILKQRLPPIQDSVQMLAREDLSNVNNQYRSSPHSTNIKNANHHADALAAAAALQPSPVIVTKALQRLPNIRKQSLQLQQQGIVYEEQSEHGDNTYYDDCYPSPYQQQQSVPNVIMQQPFPMGYSEADVQSPPYAPKLQQKSPLKRVSFNYSSIAKDDEQTSSLSTRDFITLETDNLCSPAGYSTGGGDHHSAANNKTPRRASNDDDKEKGKYPGRRPSAAKPQHQLGHSVT